MVAGHHRSASCSRTSGTALAKGEAVVREARRAHLLPIDRCYLVEVRRDSSLAAELSPANPQVRQTRLWTRGDRFWVESVRPEQRWAWGRDEANRFWIAFGPHTAVRMEADEVPFWLNVHCDLHSLNFEKWLGEVLNRFELTRETKPGDADSSTIVVRATARARSPCNPQYPTVASAELEIDAETRVVRRMVVRRVLNGEPFATVTYTLAETDALDPADYQARGPPVGSVRDLYPRERAGAAEGASGPLVRPPLGPSVFQRPNCSSDPHALPRKDPSNERTPISASPDFRLGRLAALRLPWSPRPRQQPRPAQTRSGRFALGDTNLDGKLSLDEFRELVTERAAAQERRQESRCRERSRNRSSGGSTPTATGRSPSGIPPHRRAARRQRARAVRQEKAAGPFAKGGTGQKKGGGTRRSGRETQARRRARQPSGRSRPSRPSSSRPRSGPC